MRASALLLLSLGAAGCGVLSAPAAAPGGERDCAHLLQTATAALASAADSAAASHHAHAVAMHEYHHCLAG